MDQPHRKIKIVSPILIDGKHAEPGSVVSVPHHVAQELIGSGAAMNHGEGKEHDATGLSTRDQDTENADPESEHRDPGAHRRGQAPPTRK